MLLALGLAVTTVSATGEAPLPSSVPAARHEAMPPIRHVFVLLLENQSYGVTFGSHAPASYLARTLPARGALLSQYYAHRACKSRQLHRAHQRAGTQSRHPARLLDVRGFSG
jgi:hypothetical protein